MRKKILTWLALAAMLVQSVAPVVPAYAETATYADVSANDIVTDDVLDISTNDISANDISANENDISGEDIKETITDKEDEVSPSEDTLDVSDNDEETGDADAEDDSVVSDDITSNDVIEESEEDLDGEEELSDAIRESYPYELVTNIYLYDRYDTVNNYGDGITINSYVGETREFLCKVVPETAYNREYTITSSDSKVVSVDKYGTVKALKNGKATITITTVGLTVNQTHKSKSYHFVVDPKNTPKKFKTAKLTVQKTTAEWADIKSSDGAAYLPISAEFDKAFTGKVNLSINDPKIAVWSDSKKGTATVSCVDGKISDSIKFIQPGVVTVTATTENVYKAEVKYETKQLTSTITVNGYYYTGSNQYYIKNGRPITGLVAIAPSTLKYVSSGNAALKAKNAYVYYADPQTGKFSSGVYTIGKKQYLFDTHLQKGTSDKYTCSYNSKKYCVNKKGEIQTGWIKIDSKEYYYDPATGCRAEKGSWVPRGKGMTYIINDDASFGISKGTYPLGDYYYFFGADGLVCKGLFYINNDNNVVKASKASKGVYSDPVTGILSDSYKITANGKYYYTDLYGYIILGCYYKGGDGNYHISDKNGAAITNKFAAYKGDTYYADETGCLLTDCTKVINGKTYTFDSNGKRKDIKSEYEKLDSTYLYHVDDLNYNVFVKNADKKKADKGLQFFYYEDSDYHRIENGWIRYKGEDTYYTSNNGVPVAGLQKIDGKTYYFDPATAMLHRESGVITYNKKKYYCRSDGSIELGTDVSPLDKKGFYLTGGKYYLVKNESGELATGITTFNGKKYLLKDDCTLAYSSYSVEYKGKYYLINNDGSNATSWYIITDESEQVFYTRGSNLYALNKDGSTKSGFFTKGKKSYYAAYDGWVYPGGLWLINDKLYNFSTEKADPYIITGWQKMHDPNIRNMKEYKGDYYFYFDPKTKAAATGKVKTNPLTLDQYGYNIVLNDDGSFKLGKTKENVFFNISDTTKPLGALCIRTQIKIDEKIYSTKGNGTITYSTDSQNSVVVDGESFDSYVTSDGSFAVGRTRVKREGKPDAYYYFTKDGLIESNVFRKSSGKWYFYGKNGQMAYDPAVINIRTNSSVIAVFNKDGSLKNFVTYVNGKAQILKNTAVGIGDNMLVTGNTYDLDDKGQIRTGYIKYDHLNVVSDGSASIINDDGSRTLNNKNTITKIKDKYYLSCNSAVMTNTKTAYKVEDYSSLPAADRKYFDDLSKVVDDILVYVNADGTLSAHELNIDKRPIHTNKYGVKMVSYSNFEKYNGKWYITDNSKGKAGSVTNDHYFNCSSETGDYEEVIISWDENGKLLPIKNAFSGKPINGVYEISDGFIYNFKSGLPEGGKSAAVYRYGVKGTLDFDKDTGRAYYCDSTK